MDLTLDGGRVLRPHGFDDAPLSFQNGMIVAGTQARSVDLSGLTVLPGIVDIHGDGFERHLAPRRGVMKDLSEGLSSTEAELAANGITTAILAQFWSWEGGMRGPEFARRLLSALAQYRSQGTDLRVQLRFEYAMVDSYAEVADFVAAHGIEYLVLNDHIPHAALDKGKKPPRLTGQALKGGRSPEKHLELLNKLHAQRTEAEEAVVAFAADLRAKGVRLGSHDDANAADRTRWQARGVDLSEFPESLAAAEAARGGVILGAPNVVRGGSHSGNVSAADLVRAGLGDALASDYHYPAPRQAAHILADDIGLDRAWRLVSEGPARLLGLKDRGDLAVGKRADLVVLDSFGRIGATIAGGRITYLSGDVAARFLNVRTA